MAAGAERVVGDPVRGAGVAFGGVRRELDLEVLGSRGQHPPHVAGLLARQIAEGGVAEVGVGRVEHRHRLAVVAVEGLVEALDQCVVRGHEATLSHPPLSFPASGRGAAW